MHKCGIFFSSECELTFNAIVIERTLWLYPTTSLLNACAETAGLTEIHVSENRCALPCEQGIKREWSFEARIASGYKTFGVRQEKLQRQEEGWEKKD